MAKPTVYDLPDDVLVERFALACARAGASGSGLGIDIMHGENVIGVQYVRGALLARLAKVVPPFKPVDQLRLRPGMERYIGHDQVPIKLGEVHSVKSVFYENGKWTLAFSDIDEFDRNGDIRRRYPAEAFELLAAPQADTPPA